MENDTWIRNKLIEKSIDDRLSASVIKKVYKKLISVAKRGKQNNRQGIVFYGKIMDMIGLDREDPHDREYVLGNMLGAISEHEKEKGRPLLSAIVVRKDGKMPGLGFYGFNDTNLSDNNFWVNEIKKVWDYWSKH
jgi:hypothetical protein